MRIQLWYSKPITKNRLIAGYILGPILVAIAAYIQIVAQDYLMFLDNHYSTPITIVFLIPMAIVTIIGGRGPGWLSLVWSVLAAIGPVMAPRHTFGIEHVSDAGHLIALVISGSLLVWVVEAIRVAAVEEASYTSRLKLLHEREMNTANLLQDSVLPRQIEPITGLDLSLTYKAALDESRIGGDFYDVFGLTETRTVMVVGDVSGKGLTAAAQIGTIRHMLRYALYQHSDLAEAICELNKILAERQLLAGFATLFVGIYDRDEKTLEYVSCGQEPGLLSRYHRQDVEELPPTGPILGAIAEFVYFKRIIKMGYGDTLVAFTDGLSEAGPNRLRMLGTDGLKQLVKSGEASTPGLVNAADRARQIVDQASRFADGSLHDDICLLVATVDASPVSDVIIPVEIADERLPVGI